MLDYGSSKSLHSKVGLRHSKMTRGCGSLNSFHCKLGLHQLKFPRECETADLWSLCFHYLKLFCEFGAVNPPNIFKTKLFFLSLKNYPLMWILDSKSFKKFKTMRVCGSSKPLHCNFSMVKSVSINQNLPVNVGLWVLKVSPLDTQGSSIGRAARVVTQFVSVQHLSRHWGTAVQQYGDIATACRCQTHWGGERAEYSCHASTIKACRLPSAGSKTPTSI